MLHFLSKVENMIDLTRMRLFIFIICYLSMEYNARSMNLRLQSSHLLEDITNPSRNGTSDIDSEYFDIVEGITTGIERAIKECKHQFTWDPWNCPVTLEHVLSPTNKGTQVSVNREDSFLQAISSAGIMHYVSKICNKGNDGSNHGCECDPIKDQDPDPDFNWSGCGDNVKFGKKVSTLVLGTDSESEDELTAIKSHNERAGQKAVIQHVRMNCKCLGLTGSCSIKTCWKELGNFREVGDFLKEKYRSATQVQKAPVHNKEKTTTRNKKRHQHEPSISRDDLIYVDESPSYCLADLSAGLNGTLGRECRPLQLGEGIIDSVNIVEYVSCGKLCENCGYEVESRIVQETYECECKFKWCCIKQCNQCQRNVTKYFCKVNETVNNF